MNSCLCKTLFTGKRVTSATDQGSDVESDSGGLALGGRYLVRVIPLRCQVESYMLLLVLEFSHAGLVVHGIIKMLTL